MAAIQRAVDAGIVLVFAAGNENLADPGPGLAKAEEIGRGHIIIAGAHGPTREAADFSNKPGTTAASYLVAAGVYVATVAPGAGNVQGASGTSVAAPVISGGAALLAQAFPNLTGRQIVELLLKTADNPGAAGTDAVYGRGILNIERAFQPQGPTALAGTGIAVSAVEDNRSSPAMGDAKGASQGAIILDGYSRAFAVDLARTLSSAPVERPLAQTAGEHDYRTSTGSVGGLSFSITARHDRNGQAHVSLAHAGLTYEDSRRAKAIAGAALARLSPKTAIAMGFSETGRGLQQRLSGAFDKAFLVARHPASRAAFKLRRITASASATILDRLRLPSQASAAKLLCRPFVQVRISHDIRSAR